MLIHCWALTADGRRVASADLDGRIRLYDTCGTPVLTCGCPGGSIQSLAFTPGGRLLAVCVEGRMATLVDVATGRPVTPLQGHAGDIVRAALSPDGRSVATCDKEGSVRLWEAATGRSRACLQPAGPAGFLATSFSPDGTLLAAGGVSLDAAADAFVGVLVLWDVASGRERARFTEPDLIPLELAFSPDATRVAGAGKGLTWAGDGGIALWDLATGPRWRRVLPTDEFPYATAFSPDGRAVAASVSRSGWVWDADTGRECGGFAGYGAAAFTPDGKALLLGSADGTVRVQDWTSPPE